MVQPNVLYPEDEVMDGVQLFEDRAFTVNVQKNANCVNVWLNAEAAIVMMALNVWMRFQNTDCSESLIPAVGPEQVMGIVATGCNDPGGTEMEFTVVGLEVYGTVEAGDVYAIYCEDGFTQIYGTVVSYVEGTDTLTVEFGVDLDCTYGGGFAAALVVKHAENSP